MARERHTGNNACKQLHAFIPHVIGVQYQVLQGLIMTESLAELLDALDADPVLAQVCSETPGRKAGCFTLHQKDG